MWLPPRRSSRKAIKSQRLAPKTITPDGYAALHPAVREMKDNGLLPEDTKVRSSKHLNNLIGQGSPQQGLALNTLCSQEVQHASFIGHNRFHDSPALVRAERSLCRGSILLVRSCRRFQGAIRQQQGFAALAKDLWVMRIIKTKLHGKWTLSQSWPRSKTVSVARFLCFFTLARVATAEAMTLTAFRAL